LSAAIERNTPTNTQNNTSTIPAQCQPNASAMPAQCQRAQREVKMLAKFTDLEQGILTIKSPKARIAGPMPGLSQ
jgi:hypothetical protein